MNKIFCLLTPSLEKDLIQNANEDEIYSFLIAITSLFNRFSNELLLILPKNLEYYFHSLKLKTALSVLKAKGRNSNIIFANVSKKNGCQQELVSHLFGASEEELSSRLIVNFIYENKYPLLYEYRSSTLNILNKNECNLCSGHELCSLKFEMPVTNIKIDKIEEMVERYGLYFSQVHQAENLISEDFLNEEQLKFIAFFQCLKNKVHTKDILKLNSFFYIENFFNDLKDATNFEIKNIAFCSFRAHAFETVKNNLYATQFSIDWHENNPKDFEGVNLYRCDVCDDHERGKYQSGTKRLLIGKYKGHSYVLAYTTEHDFIGETTKNRVRELKKIIDEKKDSK